jgi:hypothetical protein
MAIEDLVFGFKTQLPVSLNNSRFLRPMAIRDYSSKLTYYFDKYEYPAQFTFQLYGTTSQDISQELFDMLYCINEKLVGIMEVKMMPFSDIFSERFLIASGENYHRVEINSEISPFFVQRSGIDIQGNRYENQAYYLELNYSNIIPHLEEMGIYFHSNPMVAVSKESYELIERSYNEGNKFGKILISLVCETETSFIRNNH